MHHVIPKTLGGTKTLPLCAVCHGLVHDRKFTSHRELTIKGLQQAKWRGVALGNPKLSLVRNTDTTAATKAWKATTTAHKAELRELCLELISEFGAMTTRALAERLNDAGYKTVTGKDITCTQVWRSIKT